MLNHTLAVLAAVALAAPPAFAQSAKVKSETKVEVKDGRDVTLTGCVQANPDPTGAARYRLTKVADREGVLQSYMLVGEDGDLERHVGHMVEIKGKAADRKHGKVKVETKTKVERDDADDLETKQESEVEGDLVDLPLLGVKDVKMIRPTCS
jgi:hypothetical protein